MSVSAHLAHATALALVLAMPADVGAVEPLELALGSRWNLTVAGLPRLSDGYGYATPVVGGRGPSTSWHGYDAWQHRQVVPTSRLTLRFEGGLASFTRGPADEYPFGWSPTHLAALGMQPSVWHNEDDVVRDATAARHRLRQALVGVLRAAGGNHRSSTFEVGTGTSQHGISHFAAFPTGSGFSRSLGLDQISLRLASSGDGHLVFGRRFGRDTFLMVEPGIGGTKSRARLHYRVAPWAELRMQAGESQVVQLVTVLPLN